jgi:hypothetical protein
VTFTQAVPDSQVFSMNLEWFNGLPADVQEGIEFAGEITAQQNLPRFPRPATTPCPSCASPVSNSIR